jgi:hypothetical protein
VFGVGVKGPFPNLSAQHLPRTQHGALTWADGKIVDLGPMRMSVPEIWGYTLRSTMLAGKHRLARLLRINPSRTR